MNEIGERPWGKYYVIFDEPNFKLKRIEVKPGKDYHISITITVRKLGQSSKEQLK